MQWNETDLAYLRRRLEEDGIAFWHKRAAGQHTLVVTDGTLAYTDGPDPDAGNLNGVVAVRADFDIVHNESIVLAAEQKPFQWVDVYDGDPHSSQLTIPSDFVPYKPATDITALATSFAPNGSSATDWTCGIQIEGRAKKVLHVYGPRFWLPLQKGVRPTLHGSDAEHGFLGWQLGPAEPVSSVPLDWRLAHGGARPPRPSQETPLELHPFNGLGPGLLEQDSFRRNHTRSL